MKYLELKKGMYEFDKSFGAYKYIAGVDEVVGDL